MADLSAAQLLIIRRRIGDHRQDNQTPSGMYDLSDTVIEAIFDDANMGNSDMLLTTVWCLRERWGMAINDVGLSGEFGNAQHNQKQEQIKTLLDYWEGMAGLSGGQSLGSEVTHPYRKDSRATEAPTYPYGTDNDDDRHITIYY